jgi:tRNA-specific 2-thiouridylase
MSGGVDSAAAAALLAEQGHACAGVHLKLFAGADALAPGSRTCCSLADAEDARAAAQKLGLPFYVFSFTRQFEDAVIRRFVEGYLKGETPNPCIDCNKYIKFSALLERARTLEYDGIATGHYVRREFDGRWQLRRGADANKDQSYVLYALTQGQLAHTHFPLGDMTKAQTRALAETRGLLNAHKRDSQDICFVPDGDYGAFIERYLGQPLKTGAFVDPDGHVLGRHRGAARYTLGQRKGLGLALPRPGYVCAVRPESNTVVVGDEDLLYARELTAHDINLIAVDQLARPTRCKVKIRYRQPEQWATAEQTGECSLRILFDEPQRAITPGQAVVLYDGEYVLGGGLIRRQGSGGRRQEQGPIGIRD